MNTAKLINLEFSKKCEFLKRGYFYSDSDISRIRHTAEVKLLEETLARILLLHEIKTSDLFFFIFRTSAKM